MALSIPPIPRLPGAAGIGQGVVQGTVSRAVGNWSPGMFVPNRRSIGGIHAQVTISENERDELQITEHPVEQGAPISDHAFKRPSEVRIRAAWSCSGSGDLSASGNGVYGLLLSWQAALNPFELYTGKRVYKDMLIQSLQITTDNHSEWSLMADITCRQVIIVSTTVTKAAKGGGEKPAAPSDNAANQKDPEKNQPKKERGNVNGARVDGAVQKQAADEVGKSVTVGSRTAKNIDLGATFRESAVSIGARPAQPIQPPLNPPTLRIPTRPEIRGSAR